MEEIPYVDSLTDEVCRFLLINEDVGRVAFVEEDGYPVVLPVNYFIEGDYVVLRTGPGAKLDEIPLRQVGFEVDHLAPANRSGWSVLVQGQGLEITRALDELHASLRDRPLETWAPGAKEHWLAIKIDRITGRRIVRSPPPR